MEPGVLKSLVRGDAARRVEFEEAGQKGDTISVQARCQLQRHRPYLDPSLDIDMIFTLNLSRDMVLRNSDGQRREILVAANDSSMVVY